MIEIGDKPILWHIMKLYLYYGFNDFIICCGYMQHVIKQWFSNYYLYNCDVTFDFTHDNKLIVHNNDVNVMGAINILECVRLTDSVKSFVNVTTDKVYKNKEKDKLVLVSVV